jgi:hypothetical protein
MQRPSLWAILSGAGAVSKTENFRGKKIRVWKIAANFNESTEAAANELEDEYNDDDPRIQLLRMGSKLNYPKLELSQGHYIDSAEANWRAFVQKANDDQIEEALKATEFEVLIKLEL